MKVGFDWEQAVPPVPSIGKQPRVRKGEPSMQADCCSDASSGSDQCFFDLLSDSFGEDCARELVGIYIDTTPPLINSAKDAVRTHDEHKLEAIVHELKGASSALFLTEVADLCNRIEFAAHESNWDEIDETLPLLEQQFGRTMEEIRRTVPS